MNSYYIKNITTNHIIPTSTLNSQNILVLLQELKKLRVFAGPDTELGLFNDRDERVTQVIINVEEL